jgi:NAD-dependent SIR2 family protein deacetylase
MDRLDMNYKWMRDIDDIVETLINGKESDRTCSLLIGAGCSVSAGIPPASGFVAEIKNRYKRAYSRANPKDYPHCMDELFPGQRRDLIYSFIQGSKINRAHHGIALLMHNGFIDRVLTTNFDPLVLRACAKIGIFPSVYDFASSNIFKPDEIFGEAIYHLHGQHSGFILLNTEKELENNKQKLKPAFKDAGRGRTWLVVGYSGKNDPILEILTEVDDYRFGLFWVGRKDEPSDHIRDKLLATEMHACYVPGYDADDFFTELTNKLNIADMKLMRNKFQGWTKD